MRLVRPVQLPMEMWAFAYIKLSCTIARVNAELILRLWAPFGCTVAETTVEVWWASSRNCSWERFPVVKAGSGR